MKVRFKARFYYIGSLLPAEIYAGSCHNPQTWLLNGSKVVVAVACDVVGFHEDIVFLLVPHQFTIHLGVWMIAIHSLLPSYAPRSRKLAPYLMIQTEYCLVLENLRSVSRNVRSLTWNVRSVTRNEGFY